MKQPTIITKVVMLVIFLAGVVYLVGAAWQIFTDPFSTIMTYEYTVDDAAEATGWLVRTEQVIPGQGSIVDVLPDQGEKVGAGQTVAVVYRDENALDRSRQRRALELKLQQLNYTLLRGEASWDNQRLDQSITDAMARLRASAAAGDLTGLEEQALTLKSLVLQREATYDGAASIDAQIQAVQAQINALDQASGADTTAVRAPVAGTFSALADGYESVLTPAALNNLTPLSLETLTAQPVAAPEGAVGKLITKATWYFAVTVPEEVAARLVEGWSVRIRFSRDWSVRIRFSRDWSGEVAMKTESISAPQDGRTAVVFSSDRHLADTSLLRRQTVDLIFGSTTGIRVPKKAIRTIDVTRTDPDTGEKVPTGEKQVGLYVLTGVQAEWRPVEILADDGDYCLVQSVLSDNPTATEQKKVLRAGDEVIVAAEDLFDGKVVR